MHRKKNIFFFEHQLDYKILHILTKIQSLVSMHACMETTRNEESLPVSCLECLHLAFKAAVQVFVFKNKRSLALPSRIPSLDGIHEAQFPCSLDIISLFLIFECSNIFLLDIKMQKQEKGFSSVRNLNINKDTFAHISSKKACTTVLIITMNIRFSVSVKSQKQVSIIK